MKPFDLIRKILLKILPKFLRQFAKNIQQILLLPILRKKWKKNSIVDKWLQNGWITEKELDELVFSYEEHFKQFGEPVPPPHEVKRKFIMDYQNKYGFSTFIETGTCEGNMVEAQKNIFDKIISIELSERLWNIAIMRFKDIDKITILHGDSANVLPVLLKKISEPCVFWLDGHYSGGGTAKGNKVCPIYQELAAIFNNSNRHIILIDDARLFSGKNDYPTIEALTAYIKAKSDSYTLSIENDIIAIQSDVIKKKL